MFFYLSKLVWLVLQPSSLFLLCVLIGLLLERSERRRWLGRRLLVAGALLLAVGGWTPVSYWLAFSLEERFAQPTAEQIAGADGLIVLGGAIDPTVTRARGQPALDEAGERFTATLELARRWPRLRIVFTGGSADLLAAEPSEAEAARAFFEAHGLAGERVLYEGRSRTTWENALEVRVALAPGAERVPGRWLIVTSAYHMPRAMGVFRAAGFDVIAHPVDYRTAGPEDLWRWSDRPSEGLRRLDTMTREYIGLIAYHATGRTDALLPGP